MAADQRGTLKKLQKSGLIRFGIQQGRELYDLQTESAFQPVHQFFPAVFISDYNFHVLMIAHDGNAWRRALINV